MSRKSSLPQDVKSVSVLLTPDKRKTEGANALSPREKCVRMTRERANSMDQGSFWTLGTAEAAGETAQATHGFSGSQ